MDIIDDAVTEVAMPAAQRSRFRWVAEISARQVHDLIASYVVAVDRYQRQDGIAASMAPDDEPEFGPRWDVRSTLVVEADYGPGAPAWRRIHEGIGLRDAGRIAGGLEELFALCGSGNPRERTVPVHALWTELNTIGERFERLEDRGYGPFAGYIRTINDACDAALVPAMYRSFIRDREIHLSRRTQIPPPGEYRGELELEPLARRVLEMACDGSGR